ncbi:MAG: hypothetical protein AAGG00_20350, partial [Cyanobacteria bacterium P01_H01_bin.150]
NFASSPWSMMGAVGGAFFVVFGISYLFLNSVFNGDSTKVADAENEKTKLEEEANEEKDSDGDVRAKLALKQQQDELNELNESQNDNKKVTEKVNNLSKEKTDAKATTKPKAALRRETRNTSTPPPIQRIRSTPRRSITTSLPRPKPVRQATPPPKGVNKVAKSIVRPSEVERDPLAELNRLRTIGSFGEIDYSQVNNKNNSEVEETLVASTSSIYETPRERRLRRRREIPLGNATTSNNSSLETIRANNSTEKIKPKWKPVFETKEVEYTSDIPPKNKSNLIASDSYNIPISNYSSQFPSKQNQNFVEQIKQSKIHLNNNNYYTAKTTRALNDSNSFVEDIKQTKSQVKGSYSLKLASNQQYLAQEERFFSLGKPKYLMVGEYVSGRLLTPISQRQTKGQPNDSNRFVAKLTQDIRDNTGAIAIPSGTLLAVKIISVDGASAASVEVTAILKNETEYPLPPGTISVYGKNGRPLIAKQFKDKGGEIAQYDTTVAVMGGLAKVGEIINQPQDEETIEDPFTGRIRNTRRNRRRNVGGAILEGAFGELTDIVKKRAETSTREIISRPNTWFIPAKTNLTFIVNRSIQLPHRL